MTEFVDTYLKSKNKAALEALREFHTHVQDVKPGRPAGTHTTLNGLTTELPALGDTAYWYTCVRSDGPLSARGQVELCTEEELADVKDIVGVWA